jgi:hypothetical protein
MYVNIDVTAVSGCQISSNVYRATGACTGTQVSCVFGAPLDDLHNLTGLTVGDLYYVQVCYPVGGPCGNTGSAQFCIDVGIPDVPCNTCSGPCGTAQGFPTPPTIPDVVADCETAPFAPPLQPGAPQRFCYDFFATATTVNFNVIITSDCPAGGNVTNFSWELYNDPACGAAIQSGVLPNLTFNGLTIGNAYVFCYTFNVPSVCTHTQHCPYFVGATTPLPVTWLDVDATLEGMSKVLVSWSTASERNNDHFSIERSLDALSFETIGRVDGQGDSFVTSHYFFLDRDPHTGVSYYRVKQTDRDGSYEHSRTVSVEYTPPHSTFIVSPNPVQGDGILTLDMGSEAIVTLEMRDAAGRMVQTRPLQLTAGTNSFPLGIGTLAEGMYLLSIVSRDERRSLRVIKE